MEAGALKVERLTAPTLAGLRSYLRRSNIHVLHFVGHGWFDAGGGQAGLVLEDEAGRATPVNAETLGVLREGHRSLRLVFLNACEGARSDDRSAFQGTAHSLVRIGVPIVIAMQAAIDNERATALAQEFYRSLTDGYPVEAAITEARKALFDTHRSPDWATPVVFTRSSGQLLAQNVQEEKAAEISTLATPAQRLTFEPEMVTIPYANANSVILQHLDAKEPLLLHRMTRSAEVTAFVLSPNGKMLAAGDDQGRTWLWNLERPAQVPQRWDGHLNEVNALAFGEDGSWLFTASADRTVRLWNLSSFSPTPPTPVVLHGHAASVNSIAFANDALFTAGADGTIRRWLLTPNSLAQRACVAAGRNLYSDEWERFFPTEPCRLTCPELPDRCKETSP